MSPRGRVGRRPDHWSSAHERARVRAAERLDAALSASEEAWLDAHLAACEPCRAIDEAYVTNRIAMRELRQSAPEPPRDLWARTRVAIEHEGAARGRSARSAAARRANGPVLGALSGLAVMAVVVVATAISGGLFGPIGPDSIAMSASPVALASQDQPTPTAIAVGAGKVQWLGTVDGGAFAYNVAEIDAVCPHDRQPDCAPLADRNARRVTLEATPKFVFQSPVDDQAVVVGTDPEGSDAIIVVVLPTPNPTPASIPDPASSMPLPTAAPVSPTDTPTVSPSDNVSASLAASGDPAAFASFEAEPSGPTAVAIITDVIVVGRSAAYSPDGAWFAFSARPADGSVGPDVYVWHVGDAQARPLTSDHASVFASWVGGSLLGSRVGPDVVVDPLASTPDPGSVPAPAVTPQVLPETFLLDPWTGVEVPLLDNEWQPAVDPTGRAVVAWQGTLIRGADGLTAGPAIGNLVIRPFHAPLLVQDPTSSPPPPEGTPAVTPDPSAVSAPSASPEVPLDFPTQVVVAGPIADFDVRWDETGTWLGVWIADPIDPTIGRLSLFRFDPLTGLVDQPEGAPQNVTALPGFSIGLGRLAWATPPGQGGEGSRIQIAAWTPDEVGAVESVPVEGAIVVQ